MWRLGKELKDDKNFILHLFIDNSNLTYIYIIASNLLSKKSANFNIIPNFHSKVGKNLKFNWL